jgi:hypothetical protein
MAKWIEIFAAILWSLFFPLLFGFALWKTDRVGRRRGLPATYRWIRFTIASAITFCIAVAVLVLPTRLRIGIPTTNGFLVTVAYGASASWFTTYYLAMAAVGVGLIGIVSSGIISKIRRKKEGERTDQI